MTATVPSPRPGDRVVVIGGGVTAALSAVRLAERGFRVTGVDFSEVALIKARQLAQSRGTSAEWVHADVLDYSPRPASFDLVVVLYLQLPAPERATALATASSALAPGATLLVVGHDSSNIAHGHGGPQDPAVLFTPDDVTRELVGLEIERAETVRRPVRTPDGEVDALDALVRARRPGAGP